MGNYHLNLDLQDIVYVNHLGEKCVEVWKYIPDYEGLYQVSDLGRVKSLPMLKNSSRNTQKTFLTNEKILKKSLSKNYLTVALYSDGKAKSFLVHQLIAITFLKHNPNRKIICVDHINNIKTDNRLINLQLLSPRKNRIKDSSNKTGYTGVKKIKNRFQASISFNKKILNLGSFKNLQLANKKYKEALDLIEKGKDISHLIKPQSNINGFKGVKKNLNKFQARINHKGKSYSLGNFDTQEEAGIVYKQALKLCRENKSFEHLIKRYESKTKSKGVSISGNKFRVRFYCKGKNIGLGTYDTLEEANKRYEEYIKTKKPIS
jgi:hypothetical protein